MPADIQTNHVVTVKPSLAAAMLDVLLDADQPTMIWGAPGIGKSQLTHQLAARRGMTLIDVRLSLLSDVDLRGIPYLKDGRTAWAPPAFLPQQNGGTILFFDEMNRALTSVMNAAFQIVLDRKLGEYTLPADVRIVAACNRETDGGGITRLPSALLNRFTRIDLEPDHKDWLKWAASAQINPITQAFIRFRPDLLHQFDSKAPAFPTPRAWEFVGKITSQTAPLDVKAALYAGTVGKAAGIEYVAFERAWRDLPSITNILLHPDTAPIPTGVATVYAVANALSHEMTQSNINACVTYLERLPAEYQVFAVSLATGRDPALANTHRFVNWASSHSDLF